MLIKLYPKDTDRKRLDEIAELLHSGGVVIYPTDGLYAFGCSVKSAKGIDKLKNISKKDISTMSVMCFDLSQLAEYVRIGNEQFRILKRNLPGPFTFILPASSRVPEKILAKRKTVGVRIPSNPITMSMLETLGNAMITTTVKIDDESEEYITNPELIYENWGKFVDMVIDGGEGLSVPTAIIDLTGDEPEVVREGIREPDL